MQLFHLLSAVGLFILIRSFIEAVAVFGLWFFDFSLSRLDFSFARPREGGGQPSALASVPILVIQRVRDLGPLTGAPLQSVPHGHRDTNKGPGSVAPPRPRPGTIHARAHSRKER